ncbi:MAG: peptidylprolyl isomerase [Candidatus Uhrbacteria bacterium]|nr:peptidylprolyl isomerase [Candidatus Uhrbacteria bacterium]
MTVVWHQHHTAGASSRPAIRGIASWFIIALFALSAIIGVGYYSYSGWKNPSASPWFARLPLPIAQLGIHVAWYSDVAKLAAGFAASEDRIEPTADDFSGALDLIMRRLVIAQLANTFDIRVTDEEVAAELVDDESLQAFLAQTGWDIDDYESLVLEPFVLSQKVEVALMGDSSYQGGAREAMQALQVKLDLGIAFEDVAQQYSEDTSAQSRGNLGYVLPSEVDEGFAPAFLLNVGDTSSVFETVDAFWIVRVEDIARETAGDRYLLRGIAVKKQSIGTIVDGRIDDHLLHIFVRQ